MLIKFDSDELDQTDKLLSCLKARKEDNSKGIILKGTHTIIASAGLRENLLGAWVMHTLRSVINDDIIWFEILKEFMVENARSHVDTEDFFKKVKEKTGTDYSYFSEQYFYTPNQPVLEYYQTDSQFYYRWNNINENFIMPIDLLINGQEQRVFPNKEFQSFNISKHATIEVMDWKFYVKKQKK